MSSDFKKNIHTNLTHGDVDQTDKTMDMPIDNPVISALDLGEPTQELLDYAKKEINEDPDTRCQVLADFRDLIFERGEFEPHRIDDAYLLKFLRAKRFNIRHAHRLMVNYYQFRENYPDFYENVDLVNIQRVGEAQVINVPPYRDQAGRRLLLYRMGLWDPEKITITEIFQATMVTLELAILEPKGQINGGICMFDLGGITMQQAWYMSPTIAKQIFEIMVTSFPLRIPSVHVVNQPWIFEMIFNFFKPLLNERMRERIFIHGDNMESLHKHIYPKYLPKRYGGIHPDYSYSDWIRYFFTTEQICHELRTIGYDAYVNEELLKEVNT